MQQPNILQSYWKDTPNTCTNNILDTQPGIRGCLTWNRTITRSAVMRPRGNRTVDECVLLSQPSDLHQIFTRNPMPGTRFNKYRLTSMLKYIKKNPNKCVWLFNGHTYTHSDNLHTFTCTLIRTHTHKKMMVKAAEVGFTYTVKGS